MESAHADKFKDALLAMDRLAARRLLVEVSRNAAPESAVESVVVPALQAIGDGWNRGEVSLAQVYMGGRICEELVESFLPATPAAAHGPGCAIVVLDDFHMLGRRIVLSGLRAAGIRVADYGRMKVDVLVARLEAERPEFLFVSVLMLPAALRVRDLVSAIRERKLPVRVVVGGAPFTLDPLLWSEVGADAMGRTASDAVRIFREMSRAAA